MNLHSLIASVWSKSLSRCEVNPCLKQGQYLNFKSLEWGVNPQPLSVWAFAYKLSVCRFEYHCWNRISLLETSKMSSGITPVWTKEFLDIQATIECEFTLKWVCVMIRTCSPVSLFFMSNENKMQLLLRYLNISGLEVTKLDHVSRTFFMILITIVVQSYWIWWIIIFFSSNLQVQKTDFNYDTLLEYFIKYCMFRT